MGQKFKLDGTEYDVENLTDQGKATLGSLQFVNSKIQELNSMQALLQRAKNSYIDSLKKEVLSAKAGLLIDGN